LNDALKKKPNGKKPAPAAPVNSDSPMDVGLLERLVKLMAAHDLNTVDVREGDKRVILKRGPAVAASHGPGAAHISAITAAPSVQPTPAGTAAKPLGEEENFTAIKSPMVGTFYASPAPDAKPFVGVGSQVDEETDVCIIEAMKVFNNIKAECRGTITKVLVNNGQTVEFGQTLYLVKPA
jgi:acetyl-CoA carboxylase biotin carboxyl carrier protein